MPAFAAFNKGLNFQAITKSSDYTLTANDFAIAGDCSNNPITLTLAQGRRKWYRIKKIDTTTNAITITTNNNKLIEQSPILTITTNGNSVDLMIDEFGNWWIF